MRTSLAPIFTSALLTAAAIFTAATPAHAEALDACGNMELSANAQCEMVVSGGCTAKCQPVSFKAQCAADLYVGCDGQCNIEASVQCSADCQVGCDAECKVDPGAFDCSASCRADCEATCAGECNAAVDGASCRASCKSTCGGGCDARCNVTPPKADCKAKCKASCDGSCDAKANMDCQVQCQSKGYLKCETDLTGGCQTQCTKPDGALFCDGQYVDARDQLDKCVAQLQQALNIKVEGYAYGDSQCSNGSCTAEGEAGVKCSASNGSDAGSAFGVLSAMAAFGLALGRRRRSR